MAQNFPSNPIVGNSYTVNNESWTYDGSGWTRATTATADAILPAQTGNSGKYLTTDGTSASWGTVAAAVPKITSISVTDNSYTVLDDTAVSTAGGYIKITGTGFTAGSQVLIGTVAASSVSFVGSTELRAQVPATVAGTYVVYVVAADGAVAIRVNGITFGATPTWSTGSSLGTSGAAISIQLAAVSDTAITYSLAAGSTLPSGLSLSSSGLLSGTVTGVTVDITYNFTINAVDLENQDSPRTFSITITVKDPSFPYVPLLLETGPASSLNTTVTDSSASPNTVTRTANPSTGWVSPYQTDGYWGNYFGTTTSDNIYAASNVAFTVGTNNFTVEFWANWTAWSGEQRMILMGQSGSSAIEIGRVAGANALNIYTNTSSKISYTWTPTLGTWYHVAVVRSGTGTNQLTLYINGTNVGTGTSADSITTNNFIIGGLTWAAGYNMQGYISNVRFVNGTAVYTGSFTPSTTPLTAIANTVLLTCQSNRFRDNSTNNFAITVNGTPQATPYFYPSGFTAPAASPGAALFNGSSQYLSLTPTSAVNFSTNNWTMEMWVNLNTVSAQQVFLCFGYEAGTQRSFVLYLTSANALQFAYSTNGSNNTDTSLGASGFTVGTWNHLAIVRNGATITAYRNGVAYGTTISIGASSINYTPGAFRIGLDSTNYINGYLGNLRIVNGTAVYTGAFTPPSGPLTQTGGTYPSLTNVVTGFSAANTSLLLNLADSNYLSATNVVQNNTFIDSSNYAFPITRNGTPTQGSITPYWPNGQWSNYFNGSSSLNLATNAIPASGAFTFETFVYVTGTAASQAIAAQYPNGTASGRFQILWNDTANKFTVILGSGSVFVSDATYSANTWLHLVIQRDASNVWSMYVNGTRNSATVTNSTAIDTAVTYIGNRNTGGTPYTGYISNLRVVTSALYSGSTITVPTTPFSVSTTNQVLLTCYSNRFIDANTATTAKAITVNSTPTVQAFQPFSPTASYTTALYGGSGYFTGSGYLSAPDNAAFSFGNGDFTVEGWIYLTTFGGVYQGIFANGPNGGSTFAFYVSDASNLVVQYPSGATITGATSLIPYTWYHVAASRSGGTVTRTFVNGQQEATNTLSYNQTSNKCVVGLEWSNGVSPLSNGYISNLRVVKGTAVYTGNFTPPTAPVTAVTNTSLLLNMTNAGIYDASTQNNVTTVADAKTDTTIKQWLPSSMKFDGTGDWLQLPVTQNLNFGSGNFTIEGWINVASIDATYRCIFSVGNPVQIYARSGTIEVAINDSDNTLTYIVNPLLGPANSITANTWAYFAVVRNGTTFTAYVNGVAGTPVTGVSGAIAFSSSGAQVGAVISTYPFTGYIQDLRITRGVARYTVNFSVPTVAFQTQ